MRMLGMNMTRCTEKESNFQGSKWKENFWRQSYPWIKIKPINTNCHTTAQCLHERNFPLIQGEPEFI